MIGKLIIHEGEWKRSEFPHPLVTLDFDKDGKLLAVLAPAVKVEHYANTRYQQGAVHS